MNENSTPWRSKTHGDQGVFFHCSGPDPLGPCPGPELDIRIYDTEGNVVRRLSERFDSNGDGWVSFFPEASRPSTGQYVLFEVDPEGNVQDLHASSHTNPSGNHRWLKRNFSSWVQHHGVPGGSPNPSSNNPSL